MEENLICPNCLDLTAHFEPNQIGPLYTGMSPYAEVFEDVWTCDNCGYTLTVHPKP